MSDSIRMLTAKIVAAHVSNNAVGPDALPALINTVYTSLSSAGTVQEKVQAPEPAVPVKKSVFTDYIVCLEDGKRLKMLKRHLQSTYGMTPEAYRAKWRLPDDYPMVAPAYSARRSALAKHTGLGRKPAAKNDPVVQRIPARKARGGKG